MVVPVAAWWLNVSLVEALLLDLGIVLFFLPYTFCFNLAYDALRAAGWHAGSRCRQVEEGLTGEGR